MRRNIKCWRFGFLAIALASLSLATFAQTSALWSGSAQCQLTLQSQTYVHQEIQTWTLTGAAPTQQGAMQVYPATWSVTGQGGAQQSTMAAQWNTNVPPMNAPIAIFVRASDNRLLIKLWHSQLSVFGATNAVKQVAGAQSNTAYTAYEWTFPAIEDVATSTNVSGTGTIPVSGNAIAIPSANASGVATCTWQFSKGGSGSSQNLQVTNQRPMLPVVSKIPITASSNSPGSTAVTSPSGGAASGAPGAGNPSSSAAGGTPAESGGNAGRAPAGAAAGAAAGNPGSSAAGGAPGGISGNSGGSASGAAAAGAAGASNSSAAGGAAPGAGSGTSAGATTASAGTVGLANPIAAAGGAGTASSTVPLGAPAVGTSATTSAALASSTKSTTTTAPLKPGTASVTTAHLATQKPALQGWVDLHTHPMSNLAFGGKLFHGASDSGPTSLMPGIEVPRNTGCRFDVPAGDISEALSQDGPTSGDPFQSKCGDVFRNTFAKLMEVMTDGAQQQPGNATGYPDFTNWPRWNDIRHQKMWWEWIQRARDGGLRVMVALAHNSRLLGETVLVGHPGGPISGVTDDANSADLQIREIAAFVNHHTDVMELAMTSTDLYNIVQRGHIAVVLGIEVDNLGDFNDKQPVSTQMIDNEINRLYGNGVRYIFPIHLTDNVFGDTALYDDMFNMANLRETGSFWVVGCSRSGDQVSWHALGVPSGFPMPPGVSPPQSPNCPGAGTPDPNATGNVNVRTPGGLTSLGQYAVKAMMKHGMIVDIDHMSNAAVETALQIAESVPHGGYPIMSGHSGIRSTADFNKENSRTPAQLKRIACLGGMFGLGTDGARATVWAGQYAQAFGIMNSAFTSGTCTNTTLGPGMVAFGTDMNSLVKSPRPTMIELVPGDAPRYTDIYNPNNPNNTDNPFLPVLARSQSGTRTWDYNNDGVAHYGMLADFIKDVRITGTPAMGGKDLVDNHLLRSADYFYRMWQRIESQKGNVQ